MGNILGELPNASAVLAVPNAHLHLYGKTPRPGRKLGHATFCFESEKERSDNEARCLNVCPGALC